MSNEIPLPAKSPKRVYAIGAVTAVAAALYFTGGLAWLGKFRETPVAAKPSEGRAAKQVEVAAPVVQVSATQMASLKVGPAQDREFPNERQAIGSIDFNQDMTVQVLPPYQGRVIELFAKIGDEVKKGQTLFTIDSPDLLQAEATLISSAGVLQLSNRNLARLQSLVDKQAVARKDYEQAVSDQQTAEGAHKAARDAVRIFGKSEEQISQIVASRKVDPVLVIPVPVSGRVTARSAAPGLVVSPSSAPAPFTVADISTMWMLASIPEAEIPNFRVGQPVKVRVLAYTDRVFEARITALGATVDPNTHRVQVRSEVADPDHLLRPGMFASFVIEVGQARRAIAVPLDAVVREGDGTLAVWIAKPERSFERRDVKIGVQRDGFQEVTEGLAAGDQVATEGAIYLSNALALRTSN